MFWTRFMSSMILAVIALITLIMGGEVLWGVTLAISVIGYMELCGAVNVHTKGKLNALEAVGLLGIAAYYAAVLFAEDELFWFMAVIFVFMGSMCVYVLTFPKYRSEQIMANFFNFVYAPLMLSFLYLTRELHYGEYIVWLILISSWGCDTCLLYTSPSPRDRG